MCVLTYSLFFLVVFFFNPPPSCPFVRLQDVYICKYPSLVARSNQAKTGEERRSHRLQKSLSFEIKRTVCVWGRIWACIPWRQDSSEAIDMQSSSGSAAGKSSSLLDSSQREDPCTPFKTACWTNALKALMRSSNQELREEPTTKKLQLGPLNSPQWNSIPVSFIFICIYQNMKIFYENQSKNA